MNLLELRDYIKQIKVVSLKHLSDHFQRDNDLIRCMLAHWLRKGCIRQGMKKPACGQTCHQCIPAMTEMYEWCAA